MELLLFLFCVKFKFCIYGLIVFCFNCIFFWTFCEGKIPNHLYYFCLRKKIYIYSTCKIYICLYELNIV